MFIVYDVTVWGLHQIDLYLFILCNSNVIDVDPLRLVELLVFLNFPEIKVDKSTKTVGSTM